MNTIEQARQRFFIADPDFENWMQPQLDALLAWENNQWERILVFYPTGTGKTKTMLSMLFLRGEKKAVVVAPPSTAAKWKKDAAMLDMEVQVISHAKFRMKDFKLSRTTPLIVDEFHMLGGHTGAGWTKLDRAAPGLRAPLILGSATPNYNDAERCYCLVHVLDPYSHRGGFQGWVYQHCDAEPSQYSPMPIVHGFRQYASAAEFLAAQPNVVYLPDDAPDIIVDVPIGTQLPAEFYSHNLDRSRRRLLASQMEQRQRERFLHIVDHETGQLRPEVAQEMATILSEAEKPVMIFCFRKKIAEVVQAELASLGHEYSYVDGDTSETIKEQQVQLFRDGHTTVLLGTASISTGTDGLDRVCDEMIILDDTDDDSLRRQLVGRILPRGIVSPDDYLGKRAYRFVYDS